MACFILRAGHVAMLPWPSGGLFGKAHIPCEKAENNAWCVPHESNDGPIARGDNTPIDLAEARQPHPKRQDWPSYGKCPGKMRIGASL